MLVTWTDDGDDSLGEVIRPRPRRVGKGALRAVPTAFLVENFGGHASLCPPYRFDAFAGTTIIKSCRRHPSASGWPFPSAGARPAPETTPRDPCPGRSAAESRSCARCRRPWVRPPWVRPPWVR